MVKQGIKLAIPAIHGDKAWMCTALACLPLCCWHDTGCLVTSCLLFPTHVSMAGVTQTSAVWRNLSLSFLQTLSVCVRPLIGINKYVWARLPGTVLRADGGQCMWALMSMSVSVRLCVCLPGSGGLGLDCNDNREEFKWEKKGDQGRLQGGWKRLCHHCYSSSLSICFSISLLQILRSLSLLAATFLRLPLLSLS